MLTSKQRAYLRGLGNSCPAIMQIGKGGVNENLIKTVSDALEARELITDALIDSLDKAIEKREIIKITVLENSGLVPKEVGFEIAERLGAEFVCATGRKLVFYRYSSLPKIEHLEF